MRIRTHSFALMLGAALALGSVSGAFAASPGASQEAAPAVAKPPRPATPTTMSAKIVVKSGTVHVLLFADSEVEIDGKSYSFTADGERHEIEVKSSASIITSRSINVEFNHASGTYSDYKVTSTVEFEGTGAVAQLDHQPGLGLFDGQFIAKNWESITAHNDAVVTTTDVRDVTAFGNAEVTVNYCWIATGFSKIAVKAAGCRFLIENVVEVPSVGPKTVHF